MNLMLDLLDNSYDYLNNALHYYNLSNLDEGHEPEQADLETKKKWKTSFVFLVQSTELLLKEVLYRINPILVYENIDVSINDNSKTISYQNAIQRIENLKNGMLSISQRQFLIKCGEIRNQFIHYKAEYNSIDIKKKFCKLIELYIYIHKKVIKKKLEVMEDNNYYLNDLLSKDKDFYVYRGLEFTKKELEVLKKEIEENARYNNYVDNKNNSFPRIKWGDEKKAMVKLGLITDEDDYFGNRTYCPDCLAKIGEYHLDNCDIEICPKCLGQLLSCDCIESLAFIEE